jgi:hypothetical protein
MLAKLDGRTKEARLLQAARASLTKHVSAPNDIQKVLIERAARLMVYLEVMDRQALEDGSMSERNSRVYISWQNSLRLTLREIAAQTAAPANGEAATLADYLASKVASP